VDHLPDTGESEMGQKRYSARFKFNVVLEALRSPEKSDAEVVLVQPKSDFRAG
jgi:hypothetical protein